MLWQGAFRVSWQIFFMLVSGFGACILVSLFTRRVDAARLDRFYACLRTPIQPNEPHQAPFTLPPGIEAPAPCKLINHPDLEIPMPTREGMYGFAFFWVMVALNVGFVYWLFS